MKRTLLALMLCATALSYAEDNIVRLTAENVNTLVADKSKPLIVKFFAPWCAPCKDLAPVYAELAQELSSKYTFAFADADEVQAIAQNWGVEYLPTIIIIKDLKIVGKIVGLSDKEALQAKIEESFKPIDLAKLPQSELITRLMQALQTCSVEEVQKLIEARVDLNQPNHQGIYPVQLALTLCAFNPRALPILKLMLENGASVAIRLVNPATNQVLTLKDVAQQLVTQSEQRLADTKAAFELIKEYSLAQPILEEPELTCSNGECHF